MVQKHHQEEISGPSDSIDYAPLAADLPRPKREIKKSRKARENEAQSQLPFVPSSTQTTRQATPTNPSSSAVGINTSSPWQERLPKRQKRADRSEQITAQSQKDPKWLTEFKNTRKKVEKLQILAEHIGSVQSFPKKLNVLNPSTLGRPLAGIRFTNPLALFHRFFPKELFATIAKHTNQYAQEERKLKQRPWEDVTASEIKGYIEAILLIGAQPGGRDIPYYWNINENLSNWPLTEYISLKRFQQIS
jgi:Transposase IS4